MQRRARAFAEVGSRERVAEQREIGMRRVGVALGRSEAVRNLPLVRLRAVRDRVCVALAHAREVAELQVQHAGVGIEPRICRALRDRGFAEVCGVLFPAGVIEELDGLDRRADRLWTGGEQRAHGRRDGVHARLLLQDFREQECRRDTRRMRREQLAQYRFGTIHLFRLPEHAGERERDVDGIAMLGVSGLERGERAVEIAPEHERTAAFEPIGLAAMRGRCGAGHRNSVAKCGRRYYRRRARRQLRGRRP